MRDQKGMNLPKPLQLEKYGRKLKLMRGRSPQYSEEGTQMFLFLMLL
jgi:hypothetical protein